MSDLDLYVPRERPYRHIKERNFSPGFRRDPSHCPEDGLGVSCWWVSYHGADIGVVRSCWDYANGVHFEADCKDGRVLAELVDGRKVRRAFTSRVDATNALLLLHGVEGTWELDPKAPERSY